VNDIWCGWECVCVCQLACACVNWHVRVCMLKTHGGGSLWQCVHV